MVVSGRLAAGERIPSIRELAMTLQLNPLTVGRAYGELERGGVLEMRRGLGMYVRPPHPGISAGAAAVPAGVVQAARRLVLEAAQAGLTRARTVRTVEESWREVHQASSESPKDAARRAR